MAATTRRSLFGTMLCLVCGAGGVMACRLVFCWAQIRSMLAFHVRSVPFHSAWASVWLQIGLANMCKYGSPVSKRSRERNRKKNGQINFEIIYCSHKSDIFLPSIQCLRIDDSTQTPNIKCGGTVLFIEMSASMHSKSRKSKRTRDTHRAREREQQPGHIGAT